MVLQETANGVLSMVWDNNTLTITYELHNGDYYEKKYEESEIIEIHPLFRLDPGLLKDYIDENKATVDIEGQKAIISYNIVHVRRIYSFALIADLQKHKMLFNKILALEAKICNIDNKITRLDSSIINKEPIEALERKILHLERDISENYADCEILQDYVHKYEIEEILDTLESRINDRIDLLEKKIETSIEEKLNKKLEEFKTTELRIYNTNKLQYYKQQHDCYTMGIEIGEVLQHMYYFIFAWIAIIIVLLYNII